MRWSLILTMCLSVPLLSQAAEVEQMVPGPSCVLRWDYNPESWEPPLASFAIWTRPEGSSTYPTLPAKIIPSVLDRVLFTPCDSIRWGAPGVYAVVAKALLIPGEVSPPSNELLLRWGDPPPASPPSPPTPPEAPKPPISYLPPKPPPLQVTPPVARTIPPAASTGHGWLSEACQWQGNCAH